MNKRQYCESRESIAYYSGLNGLEIKGIEYGIDDYIYCISGAWGGGKAFHRCKIQYTRKGAAFFRVYGYRVPLDECIRMGGLIMNYIFKTTATMKEYNNKKWYIDGGIVSDMRINADSVENALEIYRERVEEKHCIIISKNAIKNKSEMFVDLSNGGVKQVGYVITGKTEFDKGDYTGYSTQYIDLWITILTVVDTVF